MTRCRGVSPSSFAGGRFGRRAHAVAVVYALAAGACGHAATPLRPGDFPVAGTVGDARPDPAVPHAPLEMEDLQDRSIEAAVRRGLAGESPPLGAAIDVAVADGHVTLTGTLASARDRRVAEEIARAVSGVRVVEDLIRVEPVVIADDVLARNVQKTLAEAIPSHSHDVRVRVAGGKLALTGTVMSYAARRLVEDAAASVAGVVDVTNHLLVREADNAIPDTALHRSIEQRLARLAGDAAQDVRVSVEQGRASLSGTVPTFDLRRRVIRLAEVPGVRAVQSEALRVNWRYPAPPAPPPSPDVNVLRAALAEAPQLSGLPIAADLAGATAVLTGKVPTIEARRAAEEIAQSSPGIRRVDNRLVLSVATMSDPEIAARVREALIRDAYLDHRTIKVRAQHARVQLAGTVDAPFERERASRVAGRVAGVREVINALVVRRDADVVQ
jgi:osmotically-inducible protein OsmY